MLKRIILIVFSLILLSGCMEQEQISLFATILQKEGGGLYKISSEQPLERIVDNIACNTLLPDTSMVVYTSDGDIVIQDVDAGTKKIFELGFWRLTQPIWSPEGEKLVFKGMDKPETQENIWLMDSVTGDLTTIDPCSETDVNCYVTAPDWSNDNRIAYGIRVGDRQEIVIYDPQANEIEETYPIETLILNTNFYFGQDPVLQDANALEQASSSLSWSPDGAYLAIVDDGIRSNVHILNTQTKELTNLTQSDELSTAFDSPSWSSDGQWLLLRKLRLQQQHDFWELVGHDLALTRVETALSGSKFRFNIVYQSDDPLICPQMPRVK